MTEPLFLGPVEIAIVEFPGSQLDGEIVATLQGLVARDIIAILDLIIVSKAVGGDIAVVELAELDGYLADRFADLDGQVLGLLSENDISVAATSLEEGTTAALIVWENSWARSLAQSVASSGGRLVAHDRLDSEAVALTLAEIG